MPPVVFELTISAGERPQTYALDRAATGTGEETNIYQEWEDFYEMKCIWRYQTKKVAQNEEGRE
jgi:hypothetical protein